MWGRKPLLPAPHRACLPVCQRALAVPERAPEETVRQSVRCSGLVDALLDDVLAGDELAGGAGAQLLHGQAAHHLLVRRWCNLPSSMSQLTLP